MTLGRLDYLYTPSDDVASDAHYLVDVLGGELGFAIDDGGTRVALVTLGEAPPILLTDHLEGGRTIHVYAVEDLGVATADLASRGWRQDRSLELPPGPAVTFRTPGGVRIALYEATRPFVVASFRGRRDF
jgi:hypothetical protein